MPTLFARPQFNLAPDAAGARSYANIDNRLNCGLARGVEFNVPLAVPTGLFTLCREVLHIDPEDDVFLGLDQIGERFVFSLVVGDTIYDLWDYSQQSLPGWITDPRFRL